LRCHRVTSLQQPSELSTGDDDPPSHHESRQLAAMDGGVVQALRNPKESRGLRHGEDTIREAHGSVLPVQQLEEGDGVLSCRPLHAGFPP
jgi:hypothetical protein